jgi:hypothetical protein
MWRIAAGLFGIVGLAYRIHELGRWGFWNDEAWVALGTRVAGLAQYRLAIASTPPLWAATLLPLSPLPHPELWLRVVPFAWSLLALWLAWRLGTRLGGHPLGGLLAVALVAIDPTSIQYAKQLKQYSAESAMALSTLLVALDGRRLWWLIVLLTLGIVVSNAQLLLAAPVLAALAGTAIARRDMAETRRLAVAALVAGACLAGWYLAMMRPWLNPSIHEYYAEAYLPPADVATTLRLVRIGFKQLLVPCLGPLGPWIALAALMLLLGVPRARLVAIVLLLTAVEIVIASRLQIVPLGIARTTLYFTTAVLVAVGAAVADVAVALWRRPALRPIAVLGLGLLAVAIGWGRPWTTMAAFERPEDVGPLVQRIERERQKDDRILLYRRSAFVWSYYQTPTPVLAPSDVMTVGYLPRLDDPRIIPMDGVTIDAALDRVLSRGRRIWFVGSRFSGMDEQRILSSIRSRTTVDEVARRERAVLVRASPRSATGDVR